ncbi:unnamed protein product [Microthlaspi erraticum]|uniref:Uncharacterized protein n=1 Tax=Microthlaspi erraticum TaxID=1685480 RepID=A0A6D2JW02_9BRAS|nr:unnamed protein product [Microthlaspi erraticum]CAA7061210.1 unnamed protein product [Microthlaspi erraticum]
MTHQPSRDLKYIYLRAAHFQRHSPHHTTDSGCGCGFARRVDTSFLSRENVFTRFFFIDFLGPIGYVHSTGYNSVSSPTPPNITLPSPTVFHRLRNDLAIESMAVKEPSSTPSLASVICRSLAYSNTLSGYNVQVFLESGVVHEIT